jgi:iron complex outermembrane recepter protein
MPELPAFRSRACSISQRLHRHWLLAAVVALTCPALAAAADDLTEADYLEDIPVVLSPARLAQPVTEAPAAVTVIDREMIDASGARQIADLFRLVPGFTVAYFNGYTPSVAYHGFADEYSRRMQVLIDGRSMYLPSIGGVAWSDLPLTIDDIERIEVIRGSDSASYGSNSFLGVISITTRHASEDKGTHLSATNGQHRIHDGTLRFGAGSKALAYHLTAGYQGDDGFNNRYDTQRTQLLNGRAEYQMDISDVLEGQFGISGGPRQSSYNNDPFDPPHTKRVSAHFEQLRWRHEASPAQEWSVQFYHNYHDNNEDFMSLPIDFVTILKTPVQLPALPFDNSVKEERYNLGFQHTLMPGSDLRLLWGASARQDQVTAPTYFSTNDTLKSNLYRLFGNIEWHAKPWWVTNMGAMLEHNDIIGSTLSPRLAMNFHVSEHQTLRGILATATRSPTLFEDQGNYKISSGGIVDQLYLTNGSLRPERILSREIGYLFYLPEHGTSIDIKIYHDKLRDLVEADNVCKNIDVPCLTNVVMSGIDNVDANYRYFHNVSQATIKGLEFQLDQHIGAGTRVIAGYAYTRITDKDSKLGAVPSTPRNNLHLMLIEKLPADMLGSLIYYQLGNMEYLGSGNHTDVQKRLDMRLARNFKYASDKFQVALVVQNLMHSYQDFLYDVRGPSYGPSNLFDTRAFIELKWDIP